MQYIQIANSKKRTIYAVLLILPFILFYWMLPFVSKMVIGNDYPTVPIWHQLELMLSVKTGSFSLFVPGFVGGQTSSALTLGQIYHPISHIAASLPGYWEGKALEWINLLRLLSLGVAQLILFNLLRRMKLTNGISFLLSAITVYNLRMLDLFRYGGSLESWTGYLFLCSAIWWYYLKQSKWQGPIAIIASTYWLVCSGHPQMMYYGLTGAIIFTLVIPYFLSQILYNRLVNIRSNMGFWFYTGLWIFIGLLLSAAYVLPFYFDFILTNAGRIGRDYAWADMYRDTFIGTINNFFFPLRSDVHGAFGGSSILIIGALVPILYFFRVRIPKIIWVIWVIIMISFLHMQGGRTPVHYLAWKILPFASSFRVAGRISLILPILFMLLLIWTFQAKKSRFNFGNLQYQISPVAALAGMAIFVTGLYLLIPNFITSSTTKYSALVIRQIPTNIEWIILLSGVASLLVIFLNGYLSRLKAISALLLCLLGSFQIMFLLSYGTWVEQKKDTVTLEQMLAEKKEKLEYRKTPGVGFENKAAIQHSQRYFSEPFLAKLYEKYLIANDREDAYDLLTNGRAFNEVVVENYTPENAYKTNNHNLNSTPNQVRLIYSSFNRVVFDAQASSSVFFALAYPYTGHWKAFVNNHEAPIFRANGAAQAVRIPSGKNTVEFKYWSQSGFWGMVVSCLTLLSIGIFMGLFIFKSRLGLLTVILSLIIGIGIFALWYQSLYTGKNLDTNYFWQDDVSERELNLAYGRLTKMSSILNINYPYLYASNQGVDGKRTAGSGFCTNFQKNPWWFVDLKSTKSINSIVAFSAEKNPKLNRKPLKVFLSEDGKSWQLGGHLSDVNIKTPLSLSFHQPLLAQFILIQATGYCHLAMDEIEVYPQDHNTSKRKFNDDQILK